MPISVVAVLIALLINTLGVLLPVHVLLQCAGGFVAIYYLQSQNIHGFNNIFRRSFQEKKYYLLFSLSSGLLITVIASYLYILKFSFYKSFVFKSLFFEADLVAQLVHSHHYKLLIFCIIFILYYSFYLLGCSLAYIFRAGTPVQDREFLSQMSVSELSDFIESGSP